MDSSWSIFFLAVAVVSYLLGQVLRGLRLRLLIAHEANVTLPAATHIVILGYALNNILPLRLGEFLQAGALSLRSGFPLIQCLVVAAVARWLDAVVILTYLFISGLGLGFGAELFSLKGVHVVSAFVVVWFMVMLGLVLFPGLVLRGCSRLTARLGMRCHDIFTGVASASLNGVAGLRSFSVSMKVLGVSCLAWLAEAGMFYAVILSLGQRMRPVASLFIMSKTNTAVSLPGEPAHGGVFQTVARSTALQTGLDDSTATNLANFTHSVFSITTVIWGGVVIAAYSAVVVKRLVLARKSRELSGQGISQRIAAARDGKAPVYLPFSQGQAVSGTGPIGHSIELIVEGLMPKVTDPNAQASNVIYVSRFVQNQLRSLPDRYGIMFTVGILGFECISILRFFRPFSWVESESRRKWVNQWAYGPVGITRKLFRPIRSLAFLAYYELPGTLIADEEPAESFARAVGGES